MALETRLATWHLDNVQLRDPRATDHKYMIATVQKITPHFDWPRYLDRAGIPQGDLNIDQPLFMQAVERELDADAAQRVAHIPQVERPQRLGAASQRSVRRAELRVLRPLPERREGDEAALEALRRDRRTHSSARRSDSDTSSSYFPPEAKARMQEMVKNLLSAMGDTVRGLEWMTPATKQQALGKLATFNPKIGYPDKWKDYSSVTVSSGRVLRERRSAA